MARSGQPAILDWERARICCWSHLIASKVQKLMLQFKNGQLEKDHPFFQPAQILRGRWAVPQRKSQSPETVTMNDLGEIFLGQRGKTQTKTDFSAYRKGENARPKEALITAVHDVLPELAEFYKVGPAGAPLWEAFAGRMSTDEFWHQLKLSKNFDIQRWSTLSSLGKRGTETSTMQNIESVPWWIWAETLEHLLDSARASSDSPQPEYLCLITIAIVMAEQSQRDQSTKFADHRQLLLKFLSASTTTFMSIDAEIFGSAHIQSPNFHSMNWTLTRALKGLIEKLQARVDDDLQSLA